MKDNRSKRNWRKSALTALLVSLTLSAAGGLASCGEDPVETVPGLGFFYYDTEAGENQLALGDNYKATFSVDGVMKDATYSVEGDTITLTFTDGSTATAKMSSDTLMLNYGGGEYKLYKKVSYTVSYEELGGTDVADATVVNGQTFAKPADPKREGYEFLGWYTDSEYKNPYSFADVVTGNVTLYAQWALVDPSTVQYTVDFELGYEGGEKPANLTTIGGKLYNAPTPKRDGYKFCGWWISMYEDGQKLTYKYDENTVFTANTTLFAVWEEENLGSKLSAPEVQVNETGIYWNGLNGVSRYALKVTGPRGFSPVDEDVSGTSYTDVDFANAPEGDYEITVTALSQSGAANNSATVKRYYKNKAVGRVSQFTVIDGNRLLFNRVDNAETYYITVDCGDDAHAHVEYNIGESTYFDFSSCEMQEGGIKFTVTATADGYASTTSETFVYNRILDKVEGVSVDEETQTLNWYSVENATNYIVTVSYGNTTKTVNVGTKTSYSLKEIPTGEVRVSVYAKTDGYNSAKATEYVYNKTMLATPSNVKLTSENSTYKLTWDKVEGATGYSVKLGTTVYTVTGGDTLEVDITEFAWAEAKIYDVQVKATTDTNASVWSDALSVGYGVMNPSLKYNSGVVTWKPTVGAVGYQVQVESVAVQTIYGSDVTSANVALVDTKNGTNTIRVRAIMLDENGNETYSDYVTMDVVNIQTIQYYNDGKLEKTDYVVIGDKVTPPTVTKAGYEFAGWYTTSKGPANNGTKYDDEYFVGSSELTLYAYWKAASYEVVYEKGADGEMNETSSIVTYKSNYKLDVPTVADGSKVFLGWFAGPDSSAQQLTDDRGYSKGVWDLKQGATVYAHYVTDVLSFTLLEDGTYSVVKGRNIHKVTTVTIPEKYNDIDVTVVDGYAFEGRSNLVSVTMPDTIQIVQNETAFRLCNGLQEINVYHVDGNNTPVYSSVDGVLLKNDTISGQKQLCYYPLGKSGTYEIPEGVTEIPLNLFRESKVTEVVIPTSVAIIRESAFRDCAFLENVVFIEGGTDTLTVEQGAFNNCTALVEITLPARLSELEMDEETRTITLFNGCDNLQYINVEKGSAFYSSVQGVLTNVSKDVLLYCPAARTGSYTIPAGIVKVGERAFYNCKKISEIIIPGYVEEIADYAFYGCDKAATIIFKNDAIEGMELIVGDYAFAEMTNLKEVVFEGKDEETGAYGSVVTSIGAYAFANATGLREFNVPVSLTYIGDNAFDSATALKTVTFAEGGADLTFGNYVFNDCTGLERVELPSTVVKLNLGVFDGCVNISEVIVDENNEYYKDVEGVVFSKDGSELLFFPKGRMTENLEYIVPTGVKVISDGAFRGVRYIERVVISNTVTHIGKDAFSNSYQLATLEFAPLDEGQTAEALTIGESAFEGCSRIASIVLPERTEVIGAKAFYNVSIRSIEFPTGVTTIGDYAFSKSGLTTVKIPAGLEVLGTNVFDSCVYLKTVEFEAGFNAKELPVGTFQGSGLTTIVIPASIEKIGYTAFNNCSDLVSVTFEEGTASLILGYKPEGMADSGSGKDDGKGKEDDKGGSTSLTGVFMNCKKLTSIEIPDRTIYIGNSAFANCSGIATVTINETSTLQRIGDGAFSGSAVKTMYIPKTVENTAFENEQTSQEFAIGQNAFYNSALETITFATGGTGELSIGSGAFQGTKITELNLPNRVAPIYANVGGAWATYEGVSRNLFTTGLNSSGAANSPLTDINIEAGGNYYGSNSGVLYRVKDGNLDELMYVPTAKTGSITIPATVTLIGASSAQYSLVDQIIWEDAENAEGLPLTVGDSAFRGMQNLKVMHFPERTVAIGASMFENATTTKTVSGKKVLSYNYSKIEEVYIPANVETIGNKMFYFCVTVKSVTFADGCKITQIPENMFCTANASNTLGNELTSIRIPASVEKIGSYAFRGCTKLTSFDFEEGSQLRTLSGNLFEGMTLTEFTVPDSVVNLDGNVFYKMTSLKVINLPAGISNISTMGNQQQSNFLFEGCSSLEAVNVSSENQYFKSVDGIVFSKDGKSIVYCPVAKKLGNEIMNEDGTGTGTYDGKYVTPAGCQSIGTYAFKGQKTLKELTISADLLYINYQGFYNCSKLAKLTFATRESTLKIGDYAFQYCYALGSNGADTLTIPETVEIDGRSAFGSTRYGHVVFEGTNYTTSLNSTFGGTSSSKNTYLKTVTGMPVSISAMDNTFQFCTALTTVTFNADSMVENMKGTFAGCTKLESIYIPSVGMLGRSSTGYGTFEGCTKLSDVQIDQCGYIGQEAFYGCTALTSFNMPDTVSGMDASAFYGCTNLVSVKLSSGLENISSQAFYNCKKLTSIEIGGFVTSIGEKAFYNCTALTSVTLPDGLVSIGNQAFYGAKLVSELVLPDTLESIGDKAFMGWSALEAVVIPVSVKSIGAQAFSGCSNVSVLTIQPGAMLESVGDYAFEGMSKLTEFFIPKNLVSVGQGIFNGWSQLENITVEGGNLEFAYEGGILYNATYTKMLLVTPNVPETLVVRDTITSLARGVFAGLSFKRVELPDVITEIPEEAFRGCGNLESVKMPKYLEKIGKAAFEGCVSLTSIDIPSSVRSVYAKEAFVEGKGEEKFIMGYYTTEEYDGIGAYAFANCTSLASVNFVAGGAQRLSFGDYAFYGCTSLTSISIPNRVRGDSIPGFAWNNPNGGGDSHEYHAQGIGAYAFARCYNLQSVVFEEEGVATFTEKLVIKIGAFYECTSLQSVQFSSALGDAKLSIADGKMTSNYGTAAIAARAFQGCTSLTEVKFADGYDFTKMTVVYNAFEGCKAELPKEISYIDASMYSEDSKGDEVFFNCSCWADSNYQVYGCKYHGDKGQLEQCTFYDAYKYGITK